MKKCALLFLCIAMLLILAVPGFAETPPTAPTIVTQPVDLSLAYAYTGGNVLSVAASAADGYTLSYQWYSNTNASNEGGTPINGATEASYIVPEGKHAGTTEYYYCVVTATRTDNGQTAETVSNAVVVSISKATPVVTAPTASASYMENLSIVRLDNPTGNLSGTWTWATDNGINPDQTAVGTIGTHDFRAKFTPEDTANYCETTMDVTVTVGKARPKLTIDDFSVPYGHPVSVKSSCNSDGEVTYVFYKSGGKTKTNTEDGAETEGGPPRNAGTYNIVASVAETSNYLSWEVTLAEGCVITPAPNPVVLRSPFTVKRGSSYNLSGLVSGAKGTVRFALKGAPAGYSLSGENNKTLTLAGNADSSCTITVTADGTVEGKSNYETFSGEITVNATDLLPQDSFGFADVAQDKTYGDGDFIVAATGAADGSSVTYLSSDPAVATVEEDTGNVTIKKAGTATITATAGATDTYASAAASYKLTVNRRPVTISGVTAIDREFDGTPNVQLDTRNAVINGKVDGDVLTVEEAIGMYEEADAGKNKTVTISRITLGGSSAGNYTLAEEGQQETTTVNIYPKPVIVSGITAVDKPYDGTTEATLDYTNALIDNKGCSVWLAVTATGEFADKNVGDNKTVTISDIKFVGVGAENYTLAENGRQTTASASITAKEVGLIWTNTRLTYTGSPQAPTAQATGVANGDEIGVSVSVSGAHTNVGTDYTATASALTGDKAGNYKLPGNKAVTFKISKATPDITVDPTASAIIYGQTLTDSNLSGGAGSVPGSFKWKDQTVAPVVSDSQKKEYDVVFTPTDTDNYYEVERKLKLTVNQKEVGLTWSGTALTYNGSAQAPTAQATWLVNNDEIGVSISGAQTNAGTYTAEASSLTGDKAGNYKLPEANTTSFAIGQKEVGLTWSGTALTYNGLPQPTAQATGVANGDEIGVSVSGAQTNVGTGYTATAIGLTGDKAGNYKLPDVKTTSFSIAQKEVGLTWGSTALTYKGLPQAPTAQATGLANGDEIGVSVSGALTNVGTDYTATASSLTGEKAGNYKLPGENTTTTFAIGKAPLTVTANPKTITYGDEPANDGVTYSGFVNSETEGVLGGTLAYAYSYAQYGAAGSYAITPKGLTSGNYDIRFVAGTLTVNPKPVTVNGITAKDKDYDGTADATLDCTNAVIDGKLDRDELTVTATGAFVNKNVGVGKTVNISGYTLVGTRKDNYQVATTEGTQSTATATISAVPLTITAKPKTITYGDAPESGGVAYSGFVNSETESALGGTLDYDYSYTQYGDVGNSYTITPKGLTSDNYNITFHANTLTVEQKEVGLTWNASLTYNGLPQAPTVEATGLVNNDVIGVTVSGAQTNAGTGYTATASNMTGAKVGNYKLPAANTLTFAIGKAPLTVTAKPKAITYGDAPANDGVTYSGFVNSETENDLNGTLAYDYNYTQYGDAGSYTITPKSLTSENYEITFKPGTLTVGQKEVGLSWSTAPLTFSGLPQAPTAEATGLQNNDVIGVSVSGAQTNAGTGYTAEASGLTGDKAGNYKLPATGLTQEFSIGKAAAQTIADETDTLVFTLTSVSKSIADKMPENAGTLTYTAGTATRTGSVTVTGFGVDNSGTVTATLTGGAVNDTVTLPVTISSTNYADSAVNVVITLTDRHTQTITVSDVTVTYGDTDKMISATTDGNGAISCAVKDGSGDYIDVDAASGALTIKKVPADGKAYVIVTAAETLTYKQATKEVTVTVNKANAVAAAVTANNRTYDGTEKPLVTVDDSALEGGEMQYALGDANGATQPYTISIPSKTDAGTYYIWYKVEGDDNHTGTEPDKVKVTISPTDKTGLNAAISEAETYYNSIRDDYADIAATLKTAIEAAKAVAGNDNTTESAVADAITALNGAVDAAKGGVKKAAEEAARKIDISKCTIKVKSVTYTGKAVTAKAMKAAVTVKYGKKTLKAGTDYSLTYDKKLKAVGPAAVTVVGKGNYKGSKKVDFNIIPKGTAFTRLTGGEKQITLKWKNPGNITGYQIEYSLKKDFKASKKVSIDKAKTLTATIKKLAAGKTYHVRIRTYKTVSKKNYCSDWSKADTVRTAAKQIDISKCKITVKNLTYTGKPVTAKAMKAAVTVKYGKKTLEYGTDYTLSYGKKLKAVGPAAVTVKGVGNYTGSKKMTFSIIPKGTAFTSLTGGKQKITLKWKNPGNVTGYQIEYSLKKDFKGSEKVRIDKAKTVKTTIGDLKGKKTYYVRIRTYATVENENYYSAWSKAETVETASGKAKNEADVQRIEALMNVGEELDLKDLIDGALWESSDETVATVSADGIVKALAEGEVIVTARDANGAQIAVVITVSGENLLELDNVAPFEIDDVFGKDIPMDGKLELMLG